MKLYSYWRSSSAYRVRAALNLKGVAYETVPVHLVRGGGEQHSDAYRELNPAELVPTLVLEDGTTLTQSLAIIDWLEATYPEPGLYPSDPLARARVLEAAYTIAMEIQPISNLGVVQHLKARHSATQDDGIAWMCRFMAKGLAVFEGMVSRVTDFAFGDRPSLADLCLVPQMYNARRWGLDLTDLPRCVEIEAACLALPAFDAARPENQPDAE